MILTTRILISNPQNMASNISMICFNDIYNAMNVPRNDQISLNLIDHQILILPIAAHATFL